MGFRDCEASRIQDLWSTYVRTCVYALVRIIQGTYVRTYYNEAKLNVIRIGRKFFKNRAGSASVSFELGYVYAFLELGTRTYFGMAGGSVGMYVS